MKVEQLLTEGLNKGFAGSLPRRKFERGGFSFENRHIQIDGNIYDDVWCADRSGSGMELVQTEDGTQYTRVYAGGTIAEEKLNALGITKKDVIGYLKKQILENGESTRLHDNFMPKMDEDWEYSYTVNEDNDEIPVSTGKEVITYKGQTVFLHHFILCPIK